jgi:hypothetical protein
MFSGIQEILLIVLIVLAIFLIPRMTKPRPAPEPIKFRRPDRSFSRPLRLAIVLTILWPMACLLYFQPWRQEALVPFAAVGIGPVVVGWCLRWVLSGIQQRGGK